MCILLLLQTCRCTSKRLSKLHAHFLREPTLEKADVLLTHDWGHAPYRFLLLPRWARCNFLHWNLKCPFSAPTSPLINRTDNVQGHFWKSTVGTHSVCGVIFWTMFYLQPAKCSANEWSSIKYEWSLTNHWQRTDHIQVPVRQFAFQPKHLTAWILVLIRSMPWMLRKRVCVHKFCTTEWLTALNGPDFLHTRTHGSMTTMFSKVI